LNGGGLLLKAKSSPCTWGCFQDGTLTKADHAVFPMHVGVFLKHLQTDIVVQSLPHARGGVSIMKALNQKETESSPCTWGCFCWDVDKIDSWVVFPMHVGVFLLQNGFVITWLRLPHARGGVSDRKIKRALLVKSSPCTWGCFSHTAWGCEPPIVFPMHVGVFLFIHLHRLKCLSLPHARGGVSKALHTLFQLGASSPCTWGCFYLWRLGLKGEKVFPMHVGVFLEMIT